MTAAEWISDSYTKYVLNVTAARQSAVTGLKWFYSSFSAIRYGDNERPSIFPIVDLSVSIRRETTLPKRLHSTAVTCELNDHCIKFASTTTGRGRERGGMIMATRHPDFKTSNLCVRKDNWIWKSRHPSQGLTHPHCFSRVNSIDGQPIAQFFSKFFSRFSRIYMRMLSILRD